MVETGWTFVFFQKNGDGTETFLTANVPVSKPSMQRVLSGPHVISATITSPHPDLLDATTKQLTLRRWKTSVMCEAPNGNIWVGGLLADYSIDGASITLDIAGYTAYPAGQPFDGAVALVSVDPMDVHVLLWDNFQNKPGGDLGLQIDSSTSSVRIGTAPDATATTTDTSENENTGSSAGPVMFNWWSTADAGQDMDTLAANTPFDTLEEHAWDGDSVVHTLRRGYPTLGRVLTDSRFVLGENVFKVPSEPYSSDDIVTEVWVFGAGEGRARIRGVAVGDTTNSLRRVKQVTDKAITDQASADARALAELQAYQPQTPGAAITELVVMEHPNAELGSFDVGDIIPYDGDHQWGGLSIWVKITKLSIEPENGPFITASVIRADNIAS